MKDNLPLSLLAAFVIGAVQLIVLTYFWAYSFYSPITPLDLSAWIHGTALQAVVFVIDTIINLALCLPAAWAILRLRPSRLFIYLLVAVVPGFIWQYQNFWIDPSLFEHWQMFIPGAISAALMLPASVLLLRTFARSKAT